MSSNSTKTFLDVGGGTFLINLPSNNVQQQSTNGSSVAVPVRTSSASTSATTVGGRVGNTFVLFPVKQLQRSVVVAESASSIQTPIIPEVQKPQILSFAVQSSGINKNNQQQFAPIFLVSNSSNSLTGVTQNGCGQVIFATSDNKTKQDDDSLRSDMGRNRESLKRKLMQRRPIRELVARGILPAPNAPPSFYEQRLKLERAKMGDILKHKIEHRPNKQQLVSQHILLDSSADPSIVEKLQQLKKCKLADSLNEKLAHRPGPLELVQENILHVDSALEQAVKDGRLQFKPTSAGLIQKHPHPVFAVQDSLSASAPTTTTTQDIVVEQVATPLLSSTTSSMMLNVVGNQQHQDHNLLCNGDQTRSTTLQMNSSSNMKTDSNDRSSLMSTSMAGIFVGAQPSSHFYVNSNHSSSSSSNCSSPSDSKSMTNGFTVVASNSVDCSTSAQIETCANRVPIVENLPSSKSKPKKSKSKTTSSTSSGSGSSSQVAVNSASNCALTNVCSNSNSGACVAGAVTLANNVVVAATNNCINNVVTCNGGNALPKTKVIKFHEYKGPSSMVAGQKNGSVIGTNQNLIAGGVGSKFFLVPNNASKQQTSTVIDNYDGKMVQGIMISCPQSGITVSNGNNCGATFMNNESFVDGTSATTTAATVTQFDDNGKLSETSYDLLLQQQQLMLQWQLELQQKYPNTTVQLVPSVSTSSSSDMIFSDVDASSQQHNFLTQQHLNILHRSDSPTQSGFGMMSLQSSPELMNGGGQQMNATSSSLPQTPAPLLRSESDSAALQTKTNSSNHQNSNKPVEKLEDMKVNDLKIECKKRNLPVSGSKPHLLERLKPHEEQILTSLKERAANLNKIRSASTFDDESTSKQQNGGALPPISFLSSSNANLNLFNNSTPTSDDVNGSIYLQTSPASSCQSELNGGNAGFVSNGHSLSVDHSAIASNYSSPGIDLSVLSFGNQTSNVQLSSTNQIGADLVECFQFSTPTFVDALPSTNRSVICDQNTLHDQQNVAGGYNAVLPVHSVVGVNQNQPDDISDQRVPILSLHEDMIRGQQRKIDELQKELQRSQDILKQQQQLILAAKKVQAEAGEQGTNGMSDNILSQLDTKQMQKMHIQLFLQQKLQQQQLQQQLNVQRELVATQQRLEEEMHVHQAVTEVVRLLRQEPRVALLVLHLLKKHQTEQHQQQISEEQNEKTSPKNDSRTTSSVAESVSVVSAGSSCPNNVANGVATSNSAQSSPKHTSKKHSSSSVNGESTTKPIKNGGGSVKKSSLQHSNSSNNSNAATSSSTAPKTPKSAGVPIDMEEIFRTVLDYASKATNVKTNGADDDMTDIACSDRKPSFDVVESNQISDLLPTTALPGCDQIMPQRPAVTENENGAVVVGNNLRQLFNFDHNQLPSTTDPSFIYTKNEAFDDLMEVLRNNGAPHNQAVAIGSVFGNVNGVVDQQQTPSPANVINRTTDEQQQPASATSTSSSATFLNAFSAQDMADLLSSDWFNVESVLNAGGCVGVNNVCFDVAHTPQCISTPNSFSSLDKSPAKNDSMMRVTPMDSIFSNPVDNSEQMDWLDLILPSPGVDLPANPPCPVSGGGGRHSSLSQTPMETDCTSSTSLDSLINCRRDPLLLSSRNVNPMMAMSGDCL